MTDSGRRLGSVLVAVAVAALSGVHAVAAPATPTVAGGFAAFPVPTASAPIQLITGTDGRLWFVTGQSQLGLIAGNGQVSLLPVIVPHGNGTAVLVGAGPEGVWAYGDTTGASAACTLSLSSPIGVVSQVALVHPANSQCSGGARDGAGNGWFAVHGGPQLTGVSRMVVLTQSGQTNVILPDRGGARPLQVALGSDGAIWALEFNGKSFGRYTATGPATTVALSGSETPPYPGSIFFGVVPRELQARPDGTFWVYGGNVGLSDPGGWFVRYLFRGVFAAQPHVATTPDGALWGVVADRTGLQQERMVRMDATGRFDRSATLPTGAKGAPMLTTGPFAATADGNTWTVTTDGTNTYVLRYQPTALTHVAIWTGAAGDGRWSTAANWQGDALPANGEAVELPTASTMVDDLPGLTLQQLLVTGPAHLSGAALSIGVGGVQVKSRVQASISNPISLGGATLQVVADPLARLLLSGVISGSGGLDVGGSTGGSGLVALTADNTYTGTTNVSAVLEIDGSQPSSSVMVGNNFGRAAVAGSGTTGGVSIGTGGSLLPQVFSLPGCPATLNIQGNLVLAANSAFNPWIVSCGPPSHQAATHVKVTGTVTIDPQSSVFLALVGDAAQQACLISSKGAMTGHFGNGAQGSTVPDYGADLGDLVRFTYTAPGVSGCYAHAFTAQTGIDP